MINREPPRLAVWLLKQWASPYRRDSLLGDLLEMYRTGRSRTWYWRQVITALILARARALRFSPAHRLWNWPNAARQCSTIGRNNRSRDWISYAGRHYSNRQLSESRPLTWISR